MRKRDVSFGRSLLFFFADAFSWPACRDSLTRSRPSPSSLSCSSLLLYVLVVTAASSSILSYLLVHPLRFHSSVMVAAASVAPRRAAMSLATSRRLANGSLLPRALAATTVNSSPASRHHLRPIHSTPIRSSDPYPEDPRQRFSPSRAYVPLQERPLDMPFLLPDGSAARVVENGEHNVISVSHEGKDVAKFERQVGDKKRVSLHGVVQEERAQSEDVWKLSVEPKSGAEEIRAAWIGVYGCEYTRAPDERATANRSRAPRQSGSAATPTSASP